MRHTLLFALGVYLVAPLCHAKPVWQERRAVSNSTCLPPSSSSTWNATIEGYLGCYLDTGSPRTLAGASKTTLNKNSPEYCVQLCGASGFKYAGVEYTNQCFCDNTIPADAVLEPESQCNVTCPGNSSAFCGGTYRENIYSVANPNPNPVATFLPSCDTDPLCSNPVCDTTLSISERVAGLISAMTLEEKIDNVVDGAAGVPRLGLPIYEWWSEALHGVASSPGVTFQTPNGSDFSYATSFPMPITLGASFDDSIVSSVASVVGKEARAFANYGHAGFDFWTPNINPFRDPRWGRGAETPGEDIYHIRRYIYNLIPGLQGGFDETDKQIIATCKHYAAYDIETGRTEYNYDPSQQDLAEYYLPPFETCVRDAKVGSIMCSYNGVDGVPACANEYLLQGILRDEWGFSEPYHYITSDCDAIDNIYNGHSFVSSEAAAAAVGLNAGTDMNCGTAYLSLNTSIANNWTTEATLDKSLTRLYSALFTVGYFGDSTPYNTLSWSDVSTATAQSLAYDAAVEGMTLLKNDGALPLAPNITKVAVIGPLANATTQMQGSYYGTAPYINSPLKALTSFFPIVNYASGTTVNSTSTTGFAAALSAANASDIIIYLGGIDSTIEAESHDRTSITWPGNQLSLISSLASTGKPLIVVQFGGGQLDDSALLSNPQVNGLLWAGIPGQDGGFAVLDILTGKQSPAGRLPITQYPANYTAQLPMWDMNLRPNGSYPGRTYRWYDDAVLPFGYGLHYTSFSLSWTSTPATTFNIADIVASTNLSSISLALPAFTTPTLNIQNTGSYVSDFTALLFLSSTNAGPEPRPLKTLVSYSRAHDIAVNGSTTVELPITVGSIARADVNGDLWVWPGDYTVEVGVEGDGVESVKAGFTLVGEEVRISELERLDRQKWYEFTVPVSYQGPSEW